MWYHSKPCLQKVKVIWAKTWKKLPKIPNGDCHWPALMKNVKVQTWKTREKIPKIQTHMIFNEVWANPKQKKIFFQNDLKYLQFTIEVYGKNWYIAMYHAQFDLVWASKSQARLKNWKTNMADTRWLNFLHNELQKNFKVQDKIKLKFQLSLSVKPCAFPIQGKCHFQTLSKVLGSGALLRVSWAAWGGSCPSPWALGGWIQSWASWPLLSLGQPSDVPRPHGSTSVPWLVLTSLQKTLCSWRRVSCTWKQFWQIWADFGSKGRMLLAPHWPPKISQAAQSLVLLTNRRCLLKWATKNRISFTSQFIAHVTNNVHYSS